MPKTAQISEELRAFIAAAEAAWLDVYHSAERDHVISVDHTQYIRLPLKFSTRTKLIAYFRRYWGIELSNRLFCSLHTVLHQKRLYMIAGDPGDLIYIPRRVKVLSRSATRIQVTAVLSVDAQEDVDATSVRYIIGKSGDKLTILDRDKKNIDYRFDPCGSRVD
ncbi:DL-endopeptidase inhibitor IseA family protein [Paenibacillus sp. NFR01]|uniref:DL-endopeptidase inhibitor IseA family protein n=1 Tax=Paenibacillus sp. NFR01 TaxID=1566279 RepID=UPI0008C32390|nr:DL-endopeptidase inhibitor IseA family protein [Paenibacillus sp. NFR01]SES99754.1 IseA DL-endopeptidase inhibitor [Paenibacillus sp. NFR01]